MQDVVTTATNVAAAGVSFLPLFLYWTGGISLVTFLITWATTAERDFDTLNPRWIHAIVDIRSYSCGFAAGCLVGIGCLRLVAIISPPLQAMTYIFGMMVAFLSLVGFGLLAYQLPIAPVREKKRKPKKKSLLKLAVIVGVLTTTGMVWQIANVNEAFGAILEDNQRLTRMYDDFVEGNPPNIKDVLTHVSKESGLPPISDR